MSTRLVRVSELMKRELGQVLEREFQFDGVLVTVHQVDVTPDLRNAHVYVGMVGDQKRFSQIVDTLNRKRGHIQTQVMKRVVLKYTPQLHFTFDTAVERGVRVVNLLDEIASGQPPISPDEDEEDDVEYYDEERGAESEE
jgi:ribosome-binding factor A